MSHNRTKLEIPKGLENLIKKHAPENFSYSVREPFIKIAGPLNHRNELVNKTRHKGLTILKKNVAYLGSVGQDGPFVAIKATENDYEYRCQKMISGFFPQCVPRTWRYDTQRKLMYSEYVEGGTFEYFVNRKPKYMIPLAIQVIENLKTIKSKFRLFRHNDLHLNNVIIDDNVSGSPGYQALLYDFGFATGVLKGVDNPDLYEELKDDYGIAADNDPMYDVHYFLNCIWYNFPSQKPLIESILGKEYCGYSNKLVKNHRLRYGVKIPITIDQVLKKLKGPVPGTVPVNPAAAAKRKAANALMAKKASHAKKNAPMFLMKPAGSRRPSTRVPLIREISPRNVVRVAALTPEKPKMFENPMFNKVIEKLAKLKANRPVIKVVNKPKTPPAKNHGVNVAGRQIMVDSSGGLFVRDDKGKMVRAFKKATNGQGKDMGIDSHGRKIQMGPRGGLFVEDPSGKVIRSFTRMG